MVNNVLLVDDDNIVNFMNAKLIQRSGIARNIDTALNGKQALDLFNDYYQGAKALPDVILLDLNMPVMDGFGFLEAFKRLPHATKSHVKIVIVTSSFDPRDAEKAQRLGAHAFLRKPLEEESLCAAIA